MYREMFYILNDIHVAYDIMIISDQSDSGICLPGDMRSYVERTFACMLNFVSTLLTWEDNENLPLGLGAMTAWAQNQPYMCMLYNDEVHTYEQVRFVCSCRHSFVYIDILHFGYTIEPANNGQVRSQRLSTVRSRWGLRATSTSVFFMNKIKKESA